jgi:hypothetical protein
MSKAASSLVREKRSTEASGHVSGPEGLARDRYAELVDKKFRSSLSDSEQAELLRLQTYLDEADGKYYEPAERKLQSVLTKLRQRSLAR